jgi:hypothetical protein
MLPGLHKNPLIHQAGRQHETNFGGAFLSIPTLVSHGRTTIGALVEGLLRPASESLDIRPAAEVELPIATDVLEDAIEWAEERGFSS